MNRFALSLTLITLAVAGCTEDTHVSTPSDSTTKRSKVPLIAATSRIDHVGDLVRDPMKEKLPSDTNLASQIRLGFHIVRETRRYAPAYAGNGLDCSNCHLNAGQRELALPLVGVAATFPQYRSRTGRLITLEDRIRDCFARSMNGTAPPYDATETMAIAAYITWISDSQKVGGEPAWREKNKVSKEAQIAVETIDVAHGATLYAKQCVQCHGADGQGVDLAIAKPGPLWGPHSWNDGAGAARVYTLAGFIRHAMPLTNPGSLSDKDAVEIAAFINGHPRPAFPNKRDDYPRGDIPKDAVYYPIYKKNPVAVGVAAVVDRK